MSKLLSELIPALRDIHGSLTPSLVSYTFFPLSSILRRNTSANIPDQVLEKLLIVLELLCERWWWDCDLLVWDQAFMLCGAVVGGIEKSRKGKERDDETKEAATQCLWSLLRERSPCEAPQGETMPAAEARFAEFVSHSHTPKIIPVVGETLNSLLTNVGSRHKPLQHKSLRLLHLLIASYAPDYLVPSVLPGIISGMTKVAVGITSGKGWSNGDIVAGALRVMEVAIIRSIGDEICIQEGAVQSIVDLEDLASLVNESNVQPESFEARPYATARTASWMRGTSSQLHIAINTLTALVSHPTPVALLALTKFSASLLATTSLTLPQTQPLFLSLLLSLSNSDYTSVSSEAYDSLVQILSSGLEARHSLLQTMMSITRDNLSALPRIIPTQADAKIEHIAGQIEAVCRLAITGKIDELPMMTGLSTISGGIGKLLGPSGGIEKWGWSLLTVLEFENPPITISRASAAQLTLENDHDVSEWVPFPEVTLKHVSSRTAYAAIARMFRSLGHAGGDTCLFAVEWFVEVGRNGQSTRAVAALWCASRLLEGIADVSLDSANTVDVVHRRTNKRLEKFAKGLAKSVAEMWDDPAEDDHTTDPVEDGRGEDDSRLPTELRTGTVSIRTTVEIKRSTTPNRRRSVPQPLLHKVLALQLLSITAGILHARFTPLFIHVLYPILHSLVSPFALLSSTALAALNFVTNSTSYASPANLLLSNFDYALDAVSRRLTRRWLDVTATKVLVVLVRLVGSDVVQKAGDVVEECFDRLDEFHGYEVIVEGLVEVLGEVIKVIEADEKAEREAEPPTTTQSSQSDGELQLPFNEWFAHRKETTTEDQADYGPAPRQAWGKGKDPESPADDQDEEEPTHASDLNADPPPTTTQALTKQIVSRSLYFLTHGSPVTRAHILMLLSSAVPVLPESALLPSIHHAWPFILNRLADPEPTVTSAAAALIESLATHVGSFMFRRIWDDVWPRFRVMLAKLDSADTKNALSRRGYGAVGTESAYTYSHRLYRSLLKTMTAVARGVKVQDTSVWQVIVEFRRFLHSQAHEELQASARELYITIGRNNDDAVWLSLSSTSGKTGPKMAFMTESKWDVDTNVAIILHELMAYCK